MNAIRYVAAPLLSVLSVFLLLEILVGLLPIGTADFFGMVPIFFFVVVGGLVAALIAPMHKVLVAVATGALFPAFAYFVFLTDYEFVHYEISQISWTLGIPLAYLAGGTVGSSIHNRPSQARSAQQ